jgi:type IV pilus assembly protein PilW
MLVAASIFPLVVVGIYSLYGVNHGTYAQGAAKAEIQQNSRVALDLMARDLRRAGYDPSNSGANMVQGISVPATLETTRIRLVGDVDNDGVTDRVTYALDGNRQIIRTQEQWDAGTASWTGAGTAPVAGGIDALQFQYWDGANVATTAAASVRRIRLSIQASGDTPGAIQLTFSIYTDVRLRNG